MSFTQQLNATRYGLHSMNSVQLETCREGPSCLLQENMLFLQIDKVFSYEAKDTAALTHDTTVPFFERLPWSSNRISSFRARFLSIRCNASSSSKMPSNFEFTTLIEMKKVDSFQINISRLFAVLVVCVCQIVKDLFRIEEKHRPWKRLCRSSNGSNARTVHLVNFTVRWVD